MGRNMKRYSQKTQISGKDLELIERERAAVKRKIQAAILEGQS